MTVKYTLDVSTSKPWTLFKLLFKWRGSVWKSILLELVVWLFLYFTTSILYRNVLTSSQISSFEKLAHYLDGKLAYIPIDFMLGFFVTSVLNRWITFFDSIGFIDNVALMIAAYVKGDDEKTRKMRRNIVRYCVLSQALVFRDINIRVRKRFPTLDAVVASGFMMEHEKEKFEEIQYRYAKYWMPFQWALSLCDEARQQQKITSDWLLEKVGEEIKIFRTNMANLCNYDWVPLPIMYPQLIVLAVHLYFVVCIISRQHIISEAAPNKSQMDLFFPFMTVLQFIFYMGWLKIAEVILNPFGEDDDDFECNFLLDRNLTIGLTIVDEGYNKTPILMKDLFWEKPIEPLYSKKSAQLERRMSGVTGSIAHIVFRLPDDAEARMMPLPEHQTETTIDFLRRRTSLWTRGSKTDLQDGLSTISPQSERSSRFRRSMSHSTIFSNSEGRGHIHPIDGLSTLGRKLRNNSINTLWDGSTSSGEASSAVRPPYSRSASREAQNILPSHVLEVLKEENEQGTINKETNEMRGAIPFPIQNSSTQESISNTPCEKSSSLQSYHEQIDKEANRNDSYNNHTSTVVSYKGIDSDMN